MPESLGQTFTKKAGPLPVWAWAGLGTAGLAGFLYYRKKKADAAAAAAAQNSQGMGDSSNLGTVPVSDLTTDAQPMPIQMGDTFVDVTQTQQPPAPAPPKQKAPPPKSPGPVRPPNKPGPPTPKPPPPPQSKGLQTVTVCAYPQWCGSLWGIAQHIWGNGADWPAIYNANKAKIGANPNLIHPGTVLTIPAKS